MSVITEGVPCGCFVCSPKQEQEKTKRLSSDELAFALTRQKPNPERSVILSRSRFRDFWGRTNTRKFVEIGGR